MSEKRPVPPLRIFKFTDEFRPRNLTDSDMAQIARDLQIPKSQVVTYFRHYQINRRYPIVDLDRFDMEFIGLLEQWRSANRGRKINVNTFFATVSQYFQDYDQEYIEHKLRNYVQYEQFLIIPFIMWGKSEAPAHDVLTNYQIELMASRLAMGEFSEGHEEATPTHVRVRALELLVRMRGDKDGGLRGEAVDIIDADVNDLERIDPMNLTTTQLRTIIDNYDGAGDYKAEGSGRRPIDEEPGINPIIEHDENVEVVKKRRGRPRGSKNKIPGGEERLSRENPKPPGRPSNASKANKPVKPGPKPENNPHPDYEPKIGRAHV